MSESLDPKSIPNPGSDEAIKLGCTCPVLDNCHGKGGFDLPDGQFYIVRDCPLHWPVASKVSIEVKS